MLQAFRLWSKAVRGAKFSRCKAALTNSLFILSPVFQRALLHFSSLCCSIRDKLLLQAVPASPVCFSEFLEDQEQHLECRKSDLEAVAADALMCITDACNFSLTELEKELAEVCWYLICSDHSSCIFASLEQVADAFTVTLHCLHE